MLRVPYSILPPPLLKKLGRRFYNLSSRFERGLPNLKISLAQAESELTVTEYVGMCLAATTSTFSILFLVSLFLTKVGLNIALGVIIALVLAFLIFVQQLAYPKIHARKKIRNMERNLLPALQNILIQLNSGVPLFNIMASIAESGYGSISAEFQRAIREMNAGRPQTNVLDEMANRNPSVFFRRAIWQLSNGIKTGSDLSDVIKDSITSLGETQLIQIEKYGGQLKPLAMFYLLLAVVLPSLGTTFIILLSAFAAVSETATKFVFWSLFGFVMLFQMMFLGMIKSKRPNLLN